MAKGQVFCVTGIDTGIGKTIATGLIARGLVETGVKVITQKGIQTGCADISEDIIKHRQLMAVPLLPEDHAGLTCQYLFQTPCSPHLAARLENRTIDTAGITSAATTLSERFEVVLLEGAGGLFVPLREEYLLIDYLEEMQWPVILVTSSRLGSINHTLASLEALYHRRVDLAGVVYNNHGETESYIAEDSVRIIARYMKKYGYMCPIAKMRHETDHLLPGGCRELSRLCTR